MLTCFANDLVDRKEVDQYSPTCLEAVKYDKRENRKAFLPLTRLLYHRHEFNFYFLFLMFTMNVVIVFLYLYSAY